MLELSKLSGTKKISELSVSAAREQYNKSSKERQKFIFRVGSIQEYLIRSDYHRIKARVYKPYQVAETELLPALIYFHGGGHVLGNLETHDQIARNFCTLADCIVVTIDYRLAPENPYPAALEDCVSVFLALKNETGDEIAVAGDSAGGGATLATAISLRDDYGLSPSCLYLISPWLDLTHSGESMESKAEVDVMLAPDWIHTAADRYRGDEDANNPGISPLLANLEGLPPILIQVGDQELLLSDSERLKDFASEAGVEVEIEIAKGLWHVYPLFAFIPEAKKSLGEAVRFIDEHNKLKN